VALSSGEQLMVTGNMKALGLKKGERLTVKSVNNESMQIEKAGQMMTLRQEVLEQAHLDHHYAEPITQLRAEKTEQLITSQKSRAIDKVSIQLLAKKAHQIVFYTNDAEKAERRFTALPEKTTVIDKVMEAYHESLFIKKELRPENVEHLKKDIETALEHLTAESLKTPVEKAVDYAIAQLSERNAGFEHQDLVKTAIGHALGKATHAEVETLLKQHAIDGILMNGRDATGKTLWTTREALTLEKEILSGIEKGKGSQKPLVEGDKWRESLEQSTLNKGQREACYLIGTTTDRFVMVQGFAGTGKSTMLAELMKGFQKEMADLEKPINVIGCAPTHQAVKELQSLGIPAQTLKSLLIEQDKEPTDFSHTVVFLDESSMVSNKDFHAFQAMINQNNGRAVYTGDYAQLLSVESGKPLEIALKKGQISVAYMTELVRQENVAVKDAVIDVIQGNIQGAFQKIDALPLASIPRERTLDSEKWLSIVANLKSSIIEVNPDKEEQSAKKAKDKDSMKPMSLHEAIAAEYLSRPKDIRDNSVIIIQTHEDRGIVHDALFEGLIARGEIAKKGLNATRLVSKGLTRVEARHCRSYKGGEVVRIQQGDYLRVQEIDHKTKSLHCLKPDGTKETIYPERIGRRTPMEVYDKKDAFLSQGMRVKFTKTDKERDILANREWHVQEAKADRIQLQEKGSERTVILDPKEWKDCHWDHAYTTTGYGVQGSSYRYVIDMAVSYLKHSTNMRSFYISVSRAKQHIMTFTDDKAKLLEKLLKNTGDKYAALEVTGELKNKVEVPDVAKDNREKTAHTNAKENEIFKVKTAQKRPENVVSTEESKSRNLGAKSENFSYNEPKKPHYDAKIIEQNLKNQVGFVANHILGEPNKNLSTASKLRFGNKGSLMLNTQGDKAGTWYDFEHAEGGNMLELIKVKLGLGLKEAIEYGASLTGSSAEITPIKQPNSEKKSDSDITKSTLETALKLVKESLSIKGTLAEKYLKNTRGIQINAETNVRFLPRAYTGKGNSEKQKYAPALLSIAKDKEGKTQGVQVTYLDAKTQDKANLPIKKRSYGSLGSASVLLQSSSKKEAKTYITEGVETGLSVADASPHSNVITTLGKSNFGKIDPEMLTKDVVFCLDNDGKNILNDKSVMSSIQRLTQYGKNVSIVLPNMLKNHEKTDFNDLLKQGGVKAVQDVLSKEIGAKKLDELLNIRSIDSHITAEKHDKNHVLSMKQNDEKQIYSLLNIEKNMTASINTAVKNVQLSVEKTVENSVSKMPNSRVKERGIEMEI
jgi:conjugative transfer relaxase protein TraI